MAAKSLEECNTILAEFLGEKTFRKLIKKHEGNRNSRQLLKDIFDIICEWFPPNFDQENGVFIGQGVGNFNLIEFASRIPELFSSQILLHTTAEYLKELERTEKYLQCLKVCRILTEILRNCSYEWFIGINTRELKILETSELEESKKAIIEFLSSLLKLINLMPFNAEQLESHGKLHLYHGILQLCHLVLEKISENSQTEILRNFKLSVLNKVACELMITCLQQIGDQTWILDSCKKIAVEILESLTVICGSRGVVDLLCGNDSVVDDPAEHGCLFPSGLLGNILENMKMFMATYKLSDYPVAIHVLVWSITNVKHPYLGEHISMMLPPLLILVDDYRIQNRLIGIRTLSHVIENINATELCWYGRADIIYNALHHRIRTNEPQVMQVLQPCLLKIIQVLEPSPKKAIANHKTNKCDENLQIILTAMEYESKILMRRAYSSNLALFVIHMGISIVKHFKHMLRVVFGYLGIGDGKTEAWRLAMLNILKCVIVNAWPRVPVHADDMLKCLMKLIIDVSMSSIAPVEVKNLMFEKIKECLVMLLCVCGDQVRDQLECMTSGLGLEQVEQLISSALDVYRTKSQTVLN
jgi:hypothetical protein